METTLDILALEPWFGGSHAAFLKAWGAHSRHRVRIEGLSPHHWKWRMRASAWELAKRIREHALPDVLVVSDFVDLPGLLGFLPGAWSEVPSVVYMHENQLTYPLEENAAADERDSNYGFTNILSCVRADVVVFNSEFHRREFGQAATEFLRRLPKPNPTQALAQKLERARVIAPGVDWKRFDVTAARETAAHETAPLRILFNHRWEHDKDPETFLEACIEARGLGARLELVLLGERAEKLSPPIASSLARLENRIAHSGFLPSFDDYRALLASCDLVVSTARHEFFGVSVAEALAAGVTPLLPHRLSYPELLGPDLAAQWLYESSSDLIQALVRHSQSPQLLREPAHRSELRAHAKRWSVESTAAELDTVCTELRAGSARAPVL